MSVLVLFALTMQVRATEPCAFQVTSQYENYVIRVNQVPLSGHDWYKPEYVVARLGYSPDLRELQGRVLSVGEGYGNLMPLALSKGLDIHALDPAYPGKGESIEAFVARLPKTRKYPADLHLEHLKAFVSQNRDRLTQGLGEALPYEDKTFDVVVSHRVLNNLEIPRDRLSKYIAEAIRVAKKEVRIDGLRRDEIGKVIEELKASGVQAEFQTRSIKLKNQADWDETTTLLIVTLPGN